MTADLAPVKRYVMKYGIDLATSNLSINFTTIKNTAKDNEGIICVNIDNCLSSCITVVKTIANIL